MKKPLGNERNGARAGVSLREREILNGSPLRKGPRLRDVLQGCNRRAKNYAKHVDLAADQPAWIDQHEIAGALGKGQLWLRRFLAAFVLFPLGAIMMLSLLVIMAKSGSTLHLWLSVPVWFSLMGGLIWTVICGGKIFVNTFLYVYVYGHELTHRFFIMLCGGKVTEFEVTLQGGHVVTDKNNLLIALSPYFFPIWVMVWLLLSGLVSIFVPWDVIAPFVFGGLGFWWAFHFYWTIWVIPKDQPDLNENGTFFSLMVIYLCNLVLITLSLMLCGAVSPKGFVLEFWLQSQAFWAFLADVFQFLVRLMR